MQLMANFLDRHRIWVAVACLSITIAAAVGISRLRFDDRYQGIFRSNDANHRVFQQVTEEFGSEYNDILLVIEADDILTRANLMELKHLVGRLEQVPAVQSVQSLFDARRPRRVGRYFLPLFPPDLATASEENLQRACQRALNHRLLVGHILSEDRQTTLVTVRLSGEERPVAELEPILEAIGELVRHTAHMSKLRIRVTGIPAMRRAIVQGMQRDQVVFSLVGSLLCLIVAWYFFQNLAAVLIASAGPLVAVFWTLGAMGMAGENLNVLNNVIAPLVQVIAFADAVHLMFHIRHHRAAGLAPRASVVKAVAELGGACGLTSVTTAIGFGSLVTTRIDIIASFGIACALGTVFAFAAVITVVPWLAGSRWGECITGRPISSTAGDRWSSVILRRSGWISAIGLGGTFLLGLATLTLRPDYRYVEYLPQDSEAYQAWQQCDRTFGGAQFVRVLVQWPEEDDLRTEQLHEVVRAVHRVLASGQNVKRPISIRDVLRSMPHHTNGLPAAVSDLARLPKEALRPLIRVEAKRLLVVAHVRDVGARELAQDLEDIQNSLRKIEQDNPGYELRLTGLVVQSASKSQEMIRDLALSLTVAAVLIAGVLALAFRSLRLAILCVVPNALPLVAIGGLLAGFQTSLEYTTVMVFCICLGIASDDTIHFLWRFRRESSSSNSLEAALTRTCAAVAPALTTSTVVLVVGFSTLLLSAGPKIQLFGLLSCATLLLALAGDLILLPALLRTGITSQSPFRTDDQGAPHG